MSESANGVSWISSFRQDGYAVIPGFLAEEDVAGLRTEMGRLITALNPDDHPKTVFQTGEGQNKRDNYFLDSSDKISFFYEEGAFDKNGDLQVAKSEAINKVGHALHVLNPVFRRISFSDKLVKLLNELNFEDPAIVQSMYIFKQPRIGGAVTPHIDATFLYVEPIDNLIGLWLALEDATLENGCLWFVPGSHKRTELNLRFVRTGAAGSGESGELLKFTGEAPAEWKDDSLYKAVPVKKGDLVVIHGLVVHKSAPNQSDKSRHAFTYHVMERKNTTWSPDNWLQLPSNSRFLSVYEEASSLKQG